MKDSSRQNAKPTKGTKVTRSRKQAVVRKPSEEQIRKITRTVVEMNRELYWSWSVTRRAYWFPEVEIVSQVMSELASELYPNHPSPMRSSVSWEATPAKDCSLPL